MIKRLNFDTILLLPFIAGLLGPLGFAPFHLPGLLFLSIAIFFYLIIKAPANTSFIYGFIYGLGYFGFGVSWVMVSIHDYGQMIYPVAALLTFLFVSYLALFPALVGYLYKRIETKGLISIKACLLFSCLWCLGEFIRSYFMTGFPWLLVGTSQVDTPLKYLSPYIGTYGVGFYAVFCASFIIATIVQRGIRQLIYVITFVLLILCPSLLQHIHWTQQQDKGVTIGAVQANLSMRDKWDEALYYQLLKIYEDATKKLLGTDLIILPESALPLPSSYLGSYLQELHYKAVKKKSALLLGILQPSNEEETFFYNSMISLGNAEGSHIKSHLVPFGEYIPKPFVRINRLLNLPEPNVAPQAPEQSLIKVHSHHIASLICYEIAYTSILKKQFPQAEWIVSISDTGWFGRSLASYQQLQMSQILALMTGRYHVVVNNGSLSSIINPDGAIIKSLPAFSTGILKGTVYPINGVTPWILFGDSPIFIFCAIFVFFTLITQFYNNGLHEPIAGKLKRSYPKRFL